jgi:hypothetical protein
MDFTPAHLANDQHSSPEHPNPNPNPSSANNITRTAHTLFFAGEILLNANMWNG